jgi:hemerythrin
MAFLPWKNEYSVGNDEIDAQHQKLIAMINELHEAMTQGKGSKVVEDIVMKMVEYSRVHFEAEEKMMKKHNYSGLADQITEHQMFIAKAHEYEVQIKNGSFNVSISIATFLKDWLTNHILKMDKAYSVLF